MVLKVGTIDPDTSSRTHTCAGEPDGTDAVHREHEAQPMFGKTKELSELDANDELTPEAFFGDEEAAAEAAKVDDLAGRVRQVEAQINSQFTSMAAYAQIAQEQVELARSESAMAINRSESRMVELIERERHDRLDSSRSTAEPGQGHGWGSPDVEARLTNLEAAVAEIRQGLSECLARQKALADAITALFEPVANPQASDTLPPPIPADDDGPIDELSLA